MAQWVKALAAKSTDLNSVPRASYGVRREITPASFPLSSAHAMAHR